MNKFAIILAAGKGSRMKSKLDHISKVSYEIFDIPLVKHVLLSLKPLDVSKIVTIVGFGGETTKGIVQDESEVVWQLEQKGTGHAVMQTAPVLEGEKGATIVLCGDTPLLTTRTLQGLFETHFNNKNQLTVLGAKVENSNGYGRLVINSDGALEKIVEQKDASESELKIDIVNTGVYVFDNELLYKYLKEITPNNKAGEYYLTDLIEIFKNNGHKVATSLMYGDEEMLGINDRRQLALASKLMRTRINDSLMLSGVTIEDPDTTYISPYVHIEPDTIIKPNTHILGNTNIGACNIIGPNSYIKNSTIGNNNTIDNSHIVDCEVENDNKIGPFARLRGHAVVRNASKIGNFVELKNVDFKDGAKCAHLSYLGDAEIGEKTNIGCGTIIANYDGYKKHHSVIGKEVFIGSGSTIISPVKIGSSSFVAAGSTINESIEDNDLAIARERQVTKKGYAKVIKNKILNK